jgi:prevent-host-death family protein
MVINSTEFQNNVDKFLQQVTNEDIVIIKNGKEIARLINAEKATSFLSEKLIGLLPQNLDTQKEKEKYFEEKYGLKL